jgi:hypothetical protein
MKRWREKIEETERRDSERKRGKKEKKENGKRAKMRKAHWGVAKISDKRAYACRFNPTVSRTPA